MLPKSWSDVATVPTIVSASSRRSHPSERPRSHLIDPTAPRPTMPREYKLCSAARSSSRPARATQMLALLSFVVVSLASPTLFLFDVEHQSTNNNSSVNNNNNNNTNLTLFAFTNTTTPTTTLAPTSTATATTTLYNGLSLEDIDKSDADDNDEKDAPPESDNQIILAKLEERETLGDELGDETYEESEQESNEAKPKVNFINGDVSAASSSSSSLSADDISENNIIRKYLQKRNSPFGRKRNNHDRTPPPSNGRTNKNVIHHYYHPDLPVASPGNVSSTYLANFLEPWPANPNYWIPDRYHENYVCLLVQFSGTVRVRPANTTFHGGTFHVSPEDSLGRRANCERNSRNTFWKFSQYDEKEYLINENGEEITDVDDGDELDDDNSSDRMNPDTMISFDDLYDSKMGGGGGGGGDGAVNVTTTTERSTRRRGPSAPSAGSSPGGGKPRRKPKVKLSLVRRSNRLLSAGFHVVGTVIEFHIAYIECLQSADKNLETNRYHIRNDGVCANLSVSFDVGSFGDKPGFECNYFWTKTMKDVHYNYNRRYFAGEADISLKMVRIDRDPLGGPPFAFRKNRRRCAWDTIFSWQSITITFSILFLFIVGFFALCVCSNSTCHDEYGNNTTGCECSRLFCCCCCCRRRKRRNHNRGAADSSHCNSYSGRSTLPSTPPSSTTGSGITGTMVGTMLGNHHNTLPRSMYLSRPPAIPLSTVVNGGLHINAALAGRLNAVGGGHGPNGTCVMGNGPHMPGTAMPSHRVRHNSALASNMSSTYRAYQAHSPTPPPLVTSFGIIGRHPAPAPPAPPPPLPSTCSSSLGGGMPGSNGGGGTCGSSSSHQDTMQATTSSGGTTSGVGGCSGNIILSDSVGGSASSSASNQTFRTLHRHGNGQVVVGQYQQHAHHHHNNNNNNNTAVANNNATSSSNCNSSYTSQATSCSMLGGSGSDGSAVNGNVAKTAVQPAQATTQPETPKCTVSKYSNKTVDCFLLWHIEYDRPELIAHIGQRALAGRPKHREQPLPPPLQ